jgi:large subunit ribosomal protein L23
MSKTLSLIPLLNEKTYDLSKTKNVYVFNVPTNANKLSVSQAVKSQFDVEVISVNTLNSVGKKKRILSITGKRSVNADGQRNDTKKAYVTLRSGSSLPFFDAVDEAEEKRNSTQDKFDKVAEKQAKKESKPRGILNRNKKSKEEEN